MLGMYELDTFYGDGWITDVLHQVKSGKEATVYCCRAHPRTGVEHVAAKVYRSSERRNFRNNAIYEEGRVIGNKRDRRAVKKRTAWGHEVKSALWTGHEFGTLDLLYRAGADVPRPYACSETAILMDYVGEPGEPAPHLQHVALERAEAYPLFRRVMRNVELWLSCDRIHGDLSPFNILYWQGDATIIDFPQAVDPRTNPNARSLLTRDVENVCRYFARYEVRSDPFRIADNLWRRFQRAEL
jgi:RIO kinase 1